MTVADLRERMPAAEFTRWYVYFGRKAQREELERFKVEAQQRGRSRG